MAWRSDPSPRPVSRVLAHVFTTQQPQHQRLQTSPASYSHQGCLVAALSDKDGRHLRKQSDRGPLLPEPLHPMIRTIGHLSATTRTQYRYAFDTNGVFPERLGPFLWVLTDDATAGQNPPTIGPRSCRPRPHYFWKTDIWSQETVQTIHMVLDAVKRALVGHPEDFVQELGHRHPFILLSSWTPNSQEGCKEHFGPWPTSSLPLGYLEA